MRISVGIDRLLGYIGQTCICCVLLADLIIFPFCFHREFLSKQLLKPDCPSLMLPRTICMMVCIAVSLWVAATYDRIRIVYLAAYGFVCMSVYFLVDYSSAIPIVIWLTFFLCSQLDSTGRKRILLLLASILALHCIFGIYVYLFSPTDFVTPGFGRRAGGIFGNPNILYPMAIIAICLFSMMERYCSSVKRLICITAAALSLLVTIFTFGRGAWLGVASVFLSNRFVSGRGRTIQVVLGAALIVGCIFVRTGGQLMGTTTDKSASGRLLIWRDAEDQISLAPVFGGGYQTYFRSTHRAIPLPFLHQHWIPEEPKNLYLNILLDFGVFGFLILIIWIGATMYGCYCTLRSERDILDTIIAQSTVLTTIAYLVSGFFDTPIFGPVGRESSTLCYIVLMGLAVAAESERCSPNKSKNRIGATHAKIKLC